MRGYVTDTPPDPVKVSTNLPIGASGTGSNIFGTKGADKLYGTTNDDTFYLEGGDDYVDGGQGSDRIYFANIPSGIRVDLAVRGPQETGIGKLELVSIEGVIGSAFADDIRGDNAGNFIDGGDGDDIIEGRGGDDYLNGGLGADIIRGGDGDDHIAGDPGGRELPPSGLASPDEMYGGAGNDELQGGAHNDKMYGEAGDDLFHASWGNDLMDGGDGYDVAEISWRTPIRVDLASTDAQMVTDGVWITFRSVEAVSASGGDDTLLGNGEGNNFFGGSGNDLIDGRGGLDLVQYRATSVSNFSWTKIADGWSIADKGDQYFKASTDKVVNVEFMMIGGDIVFDTVNPELLLPLGSAALPFIGSAILRLPDELAKTKLHDIGVKLDAGEIDPYQALKQVIATAGATTSVASMSYQFFTGQVPSNAGVDYLVNPTSVNSNNLNSAYYQSFNLENRYINFAVNLGKIGEGRARFEAKYGELSLFDATREAYKTIFGAAPSDAKIHTLIDGRENYFAYYGADGVNGIGTKAAMAGWLMAEAIKADVGVMARSNDVWLADTADGYTFSGVNILDPYYGYYKPDFIFGGD